MVYEEYQNILVWKLFFILLKIIRDKSWKNFRGVSRGMMISVSVISKYPIYICQNKKSLSASIPISEIRKNIHNFSEFRRENRPIFVFCCLGPPFLIETPISCVASLKWI